MKATPVLPLANGQKLASLKQSARLNAIGNSSVLRLHKEAGLGFLLLSFCYSLLMWVFALMVLL
ncbi:hypothetical protein JCM10512_4379 [Bacteroides reticulotermitis JCM 10512]|uniref:Uncharacterized protein n=1 Tax=Bacteroides reticulotermitis JCM 10512 TaxID=1445607 RepID=W4UZC9_9BACE|nr:hypothetical protein JCM10512_4379 [Bacteroides reticulotermitis JCM 10512]